MRAGCGRRASFSDSGAISSGVLAEMERPLGRPCLCIHPERRGLQKSTILPRKFDGRFVVGVVNEPKPARLHVRGIETVADVKRQLLDGEVALRIRLLVNSSDDAAFLDAVEHLR